MAGYLTEMAYMRWLRQYLINIQFYFNALDNARVRLAYYDMYPEVEELEERIWNIERKLIEAIPRDFSVRSRPLRGSQKFLENMKVLINLILNLFKRSSQFSGIYQQEKDRILNIHHEFNFKEKLQGIEFMLDELEKNLEAISIQKQAVAAT